MARRPAPLSKGIDELGNILIVLAGPRIRPPSKRNVGSAKRPAGYGLVELSIPLIFLGRSTLRVDVSQNKRCTLAHPATVRDDLALTMAGFDSPGLRPKT